MTKKNLHDFLFQSGIWLGEGKITFTTSPEFVKFHTKWELNRETPFTTRATQLIHMVGIERPTVNMYTFHHIEDGTFQIQLENELLGVIQGKGLFDEKVIGWEYKTDESFGGFETYELQENGDYFQHAEFGGNEDYRTIIEGLLWQKST